MKASSLTMWFSMMLFAKHGERSAGVKGYRISNRDGGQQMVIALPEFHHLVEQRAARHCALGVNLAEIALLATVNR